MVTPDYLTISCLGCGGTVVEAIDHTGNSILLDAEPSRQGNWEINGCTIPDEHQTVAHQVPPGVIAEHAMVAARALEDGLVALTTPAGETVTVAASAADTFIGLGYKRQKAKPAQEVAWPYHEQHVCS